MEYKTLDMGSYKRKQHFEYFSGLAFPYVGTTAPVDITALREKIRRERLPFFLTVCYCAARAANRVPELRRRILNGGIIEYERCRTSHTVALEDETYCYCTLDSAQPFADYPAVCGFRAGACEGGAQHRRIGGGHGRPDFCVDAAVALLHVAHPARSGAGGQQPAHHLREILRAGGENAAARLAAVQPRACGRPAHRGVLPAARARN